MHREYWWYWIMGIWAITLVAVFILGHYSAAGPTTPQPVPYHQTYFLPLKRIDQDICAVSTLIQNDEYPSHDLSVHRAEWLRLVKHYIDVQTQIQMSHPNITVPNYQMLDQYVC